MHCRVTSCQLTLFNAHSNIFKLAADCRDCVRDTPRLQTQTAQPVSCQGRCLSASGELKQSAPNSQTQKSANANSIHPGRQPDLLKLPGSRFPRIELRAPKLPNTPESLEPSRLPKPLSDSRTAVPESNTSEPTSVPRHYTTQNCILT